MITTKTLLVIALTAIGFTVAVKMQPEPETKKEVAPLHITDVLDGSGTVKGKRWPWPDKEFYEHQIEIVEKHETGGTIEVKNVSNPIAVSLILHIEPLQPVPDVYNGEAEVKRVKKLNESISSQNEQRKSAFCQKLEKEILNFIPQEKNDYSYVEAHIKSVIKTQQLPQYDNHQRIVFLYSDLLNDVPGKTPKLLDASTIEQLNGCGARMFVCAHVTNNALEQVNGIQISTTDDFIGFLKSNK